MTDLDDEPKPEEIAARLRAALLSGDFVALGSLLDENVRWGGEEDTPETCHTRSDVLGRMVAQRASGVETEVTQVVPSEDSIMLTLRVKRPSAGGFSHEHTVHQVLRLRKGLITDIRGYSTHSEEQSPTVGGLDDVPGITARFVIPILNVSNLDMSFDWFGKLGWHKKWDWRDPAGTPGFGAVGSGDCEIFLSLNGQGGCGNDDGVGSDGMWISVWIDDVDRAYAVCMTEGIEVIQHPRDEAWGVREMHVRHPDGHVLRISQASHSH